MHSGTRRPPSTPTCSTGPCVPGETEQARGRRRSRTAGSVIPSPRLRRRDLWTESLPTGPRRHWRLCAPKPTCGGYWTSTVTLLWRSTLDQACIVRHRDVDAELIETWWNRARTDLLDVPWSVHDLDMETDVAATCSRSPVDRCRSSSCSRRLRFSGHHQLGIDISGLYACDHSSGDGRECPGADLSGPLLMACGWPVGLPGVRGAAPRDRTRITGCLVSGTHPHFGPWMMPNSPVLLKNERYPRSAKYSPRWVVDAAMGPNPLWQAEALADVMPLDPGMRVLDMGCGTALSSIFLAKELGVEVWATDLWIKPDENLRRMAEADVEDQVHPITPKPMRCPSPRASSTRSSASALTTTSAPTTSTSATTQVRETRRPDRHRSTRSQRGARETSPAAPRGVLEVGLLRLAQRNLVAPPLGEDRPGHRRRRRTAPLRTKRPLRVRSSPRRVALTSDRSVRAPSRRGSSRRRSTAAASTTARSSAPSRSTAPALRRRGTRGPRLTAGQRAQGLHHTERVTCRPGDHLSAVGGQPC